MRKFIGFFNPKGRRRKATRPKGVTKTILKPTIVKAKTVLIKTITAP
jgi:hypothetical protein